MSYHARMNPSYSIAEKRRCYAIEGFEPTPKTERDEEMPAYGLPAQREIHAESIHDDAKKNSDALVTNAARDVGDLLKLMSDTGEQLTALKKLIDPKHDGLEAVHRDALAAFLQKLTPDESKQLQQNVAMRIDEARLPTLDRRDADALQPAPARVVQQHENREVVEAPHRFHGFITDAADHLLERAGYYRVDHADISELETRLGFKWMDDTVNYTAVGSTLYVEGIDGDGAAKKFSVTFGGDAAQKDKTKGEVIQSNIEEADIPNSTENIRLIDNYRTTKIGAFYPRQSSDDFGIANETIKTGGPLPELLKLAETHDIVIERKRGAVESNLVAKKGGMVIAESGVSINDRDQWEWGIAKMLEDALRADETRKTSL